MVEKLETAAGEGVISRKQLLNTFKNYKTTVEQYASLVDLKGTEWYSSLDSGDVKKDDSFRLFWGIRINKQGNLKVGRIQRCNITDGKGCFIRYGWKLFRSSNPARESFEDIQGILNCFPKLAHDIEKQISYRQSVGSWVASNDMLEGLRGLCETGQHSHATQLDQLQVFEQRLSIFPDDNFKQHLLEVISGLRTRLNILPSMEDINAAPDRVLEISAISEGLITVAGYVSQIEAYEEAMDPEGFVARRVQLEQQ